MGGGLSVLTSLSLDDMPITDPADCKHLFCEKWGPNHFHCADCHERLVDEDRIRDEEQFIESIVDNSVAEDGVNRGVTIQFLYDFANACNCWAMTTRDVRRKFVMPATRASRCRFVELPEMSEVVGRATTFVSHTWGAKFGDLVAALCDGNADKSRVVWVDIFAVRQWPSHKPDLDFSAVVRQCKSFMIVCSSLPEISRMDDLTAMTRNTSTIPAHIRCQVAFLRVWCLVEVHAAILSGVTIVMKGGSYSIKDSVEFLSDDNLLLKLFYLIDIESAEATVSADKERILGNIRAAEGGVSGVNDAVRGLLVGARVAVDQPLVQCAACEDLIAIEKLLVKPSAYIVAVSACGYVGLLKRLIDNGGDVNVIVNDTTSLVTAAIGGHLACVELLIQSGADVNFNNVEGGTAVMAAAAGGHTACVELLIKNGADVKAANKEGISALMYSALGGHAACCEALVRNGSDVTATKDGVTVLMFAVMTGHVDCAEQLIKSGCDVNTALPDGTTALIAAALGGHAKCVELLIKRGSDVDRRWDGKTALDHALEAGHEAVVQLLQQEFQK